MEKEYVQIGFTKKTHGIAGEMKVAVEQQFLEDFLKTEIVFLDLRGKKVPYFIQSVRGGQEVIVKFEDVNVREDAQQLSSKEMYLRASDILADEEREILVEEAGYGFCKNFSMHDKTLGALGKIKDVLQMPAQEMAVLEHRGREVYVPLIEAFIEKIDKRKRTVFVDLPEGLLEV